MQPSYRTDEEFENRKMLIDLLKEYDKLGDLQKYDIIDLINENSNIKNSIEEFINKGIFQNIDGTMILTTHK
jgi:hypothetical protein